jgi:protein SCO1/2
VNRRTLVILALCAIALALAVGLTIRVCGRAPSAGTGVAAVGGPFKLVDQTGRAVDEGVLKDKWSAVFFGFTYCPDVCPTTLFTLAQAQDRLGPKGRDLQTVFISVDPERDTPKQLAAYLANDAFPKGTLGLTGTPEQAAAAARAYRVYAEKTGAGADYQVNHSTATYLMSPKGRFVCVIPYGLTPEQTAERIGKAMRQGRDAKSC